VSLAVLGTGLVSPFGLTAAEHAFFLRAHVPEPPPAPFEDAEGAAVDAYHCDWIDLDASFADRALALARAALGEALEGEPAASSGRSLLLCAPAPRPGASAADLDALAVALADTLAAGTPPARFEGEAGAFAALVEAEARLAVRSVEEVVLVAVDSLVSVAALLDARARPPSPWAAREPLPSEAAAVLRLGRASRGARALGTLLSSAVRAGSSSDHDDEPVDGDAMTELLGELAPARVRYAFGQAEVGALRQREWAIATARLADRFRGSLEWPSVELEIGRVGAAAGAACLVYGLAALRHDAVGDETASATERAEPFVAWAISPDGTRGAALARSEGR
jgi:hypothetical protein